MGIHSATSPLAPGGWVEDVFCGVDIAEAVVRTHGAQHERPRVSGSRVEGFRDLGLGFRVSSFQTPNPEP